MWVYLVIVDGLPVSCKTYSGNDDELVSREACRLFLLNEYGLSCDFSKDPDNFVFGFKTNGQNIIAIFTHTDINE